MKFSKSLVVAAIAAASFGAQAAATSGDTNASCSFADLTNVTVTACSGFWSGNLLQGGTGGDAGADIEAALMDMGVSAADAAATTYLEKVGDLKTLDPNPSANANFSTMLYGQSIIGIHFGGGAFDASYDGKGGGTAFYAFDAGAGVDILTVAPNLAGARSGGAVFMTGDAPPIPEPSTYALMLAGLAGIGFVARRRKG